MLTNQLSTYYKIENDFLIDQWFAGFGLFLALISLSFA